MLLRETRGRQPKGASRREEGWVAGLEHGTAAHGSSERLEVAAMMSAKLESELSSRSIRIAKPQAQCSRKAGLTEKTVDASELHLVSHDQRVE